MKIAVIGAGNSGLAMAAFLASQGYSVNLWNRTKQHIELLCKQPMIHVEGVLKGTFPINLVTDNLKQAIQDCSLIFVTTPASSHKEIAEHLSDKVSPEQTIILHPGRTFGAIEFYSVLRGNNITVFPQIAETQTIVFTCRKFSEDSVYIYSLKKDVLISSLFSEVSFIIASLPMCLQPYYKGVSSTMITSFGNVGMILHVLPVLLNVGWIECENVNFKYYYAGITPSIALLLEKIDLERVSVANAFGVEIETLKEWLIRSYQVYGTTLYDCIHNIKSYQYIDAPANLSHRYLYEDIPTGLVPLEAAGSLFKVPTPLTTLAIDLATILLNKDFREIGRKAEILIDYLSFNENEKK